MDRGSEAGAVVRDAVEVDHRDLADALLQHRDARVEDRLTLFGRFILGVLAQIAQLAGALNLLRKIDLQLALERGDFVVELLQNPLFHRPTQTVPQWLAVRAISSRQNPLVRTFRELADDPDPTGERVLLDGIHLVQDAHLSGALFEVVVVAASRLREVTEEGELASALEREGVDVVAADDKVFASLSPVKTPAGIAAIARRKVTAP